MKIIIAILIPIYILLYIGCNREEQSDKMFKKQITGAEALIALEFSDAERDSMMNGLEGARKDYAAIREYDLSNDILPALLFCPLPFGFIPDQEQQVISWNLRAQELLEVAEEDALGQNLLSLPTPLARKDFREYFPEMESGAAAGAAERQLRRFVIPFASDREGTEYVVSPGDIVWTRMGEEHQLNSADGDIYLKPK